MKIKKSSLFNKKILVGITGGISAYKSIFLVRLLIQSGAQVKVVLSPSAHNFVSPLVLSVLSKNKVFSSFTNEEKIWNNHVELGLWADLIIIAPSTANTIAKLAHGICDNLLLAVVLSARCPIFIAPAMDHDMYLNKITQENIKKIKKNGIMVIDVESGELASGLTGLGRLKEPEQIISKLDSFFLNQQPLSGLNCLVTAGPTYEKIDPVRFIGNFSSGKMGCAIAHELQKLGANVELIIGPSFEKVNENINVSEVVSSNQMYDKSLEKFPNQDIVIFSAAVSDFTPKNNFSKKIKNKGEIDISFKKTKDILKKLGSIKKDQILFGFALETNQELKNAKIKLREKKLDAIILNSLNDEGAGFGHDTNKITIIDDKFNLKKHPLLSKKEVSKIIVKEATNMFFNRFQLKKKTKKC